MRKSDVSRDVQVRLTEGVWGLLAIKAASLVGVFIVRNFPRVVYDRGKLS